MLNSDQSKRITAAEALAHSWLQSHHYEAEINPSVLSNLAKFSVNT